jgi:hypothetical protein
VATVREGARVLLTRAIMGGTVLPQLVRVPTKEAANLALVRVSFLAVLAEMIHARKRRGAQRHVAHERRGRCGGLGGVPGSDGGTAKYTHTHTKKQMVVTTGYARRHNGRD